MSTRSKKKTYDDVRAAFEGGRILKCSANELEQFLLAVNCERISEPAEQARAAAMRETILHLLAAKHRRTLQRRASRWAIVATLLSGAVLLWLAARIYNDFGSINTAAGDVKAKASRFSAIIRAVPGSGDPRTHFSISELAKGAPTIRGGTLQAWWEGEQARRVLRYEAQARRQALAGDTQGAERSAKRADEIRGGIRSLRANDAVEIVGTTQWREADDSKSEAAQ